MGATVVNNSATGPGAPSSELVKGLGLLDCTTIVMGSMIGSGIFIVAAEIAREVGSPGLFLMSWVISGVMTVAGAVTYGELAAMMPKAGGQYVYLREAFSPLFGFLYGWTLFLVIQTGTIAAVAVAFGKFLGFFFPWISEQNYLLNLGSVGIFGHPVALTLSTQQGIAIVVLLGLGVVNIFGLRTGAWIQNIFTVLKVAALVGLVIAGLWWEAHRAPAVAAVHTRFWGNAHWDTSTLTILAVALVGPLFSSDAWNNVTFTGAEVKSAKRNLPLALLIGTAIVCSIYFLTNVIYVRALPFAAIQHAPQDRVATAVMEAMVGPKGAGLMAAAIVISTFGCMNGLSLAGARVYYAMAKDRLFFKKVGTVNPKYHTPAVSLIVQAVWASLLTMSGTYSELLDYVIFAVLLFYILTILGLFRLRRTRPDAPRPYRAWGYPVVPVLYILLAVFIEWALLMNRPVRSLEGLGIVAVGIPIYFLWHGRNSPTAREE
ncbi:MAG TPA: amino acid permease [Terriglobia bacterium]|nr:amino acid permease [Terriglobia bacterium]